MYRMIQGYEEGFETIKNSIVTEPILINNEPHYIFKEFNLKHCSCTDKKGENQEYWCGSAEYECNRSLKEIEDQRLPLSRTFLCRQSGIIIIVIRGSEKERAAHKMEYMGIFLE